MRLNSRPQRRVRTILRIVLPLFALLLATGPVFAKLFRISEEQEVRAARSIEKEVREKFRLFPDLSARLASISRRLLGAGPWPKKFAESYSFHVVEDPRDPKTLNAFAAPGGLICFYKELYDQLLQRYGEDAVAAVLAHEIEHAANHHSARAIENQMEKQLLFGILLGATGAGDAVATVTNVFLGLRALRYSRSNENEADEKGIVRLWRAGYKTEAMAQTFEFLKEKSRGDRPALYFSSHPSDDRRIERARNRQAYLKQRNPVETRREGTISYRDGRPFVTLGWIDGLTRDTKLLGPNGRSFGVGDIQMGIAEVRARSAELADGARLQTDKAIVSSFGKPVGVGSITAVDTNQNRVQIDLGGWQGLKPGAGFRVVRSRLQDQKSQPGNRAADRREQVRVVQAMATAQVREVSDRSAVLDIVAFGLDGTAAFSIRDIVAGLEVRMEGWPDGGQGDKVTR